MQTQPLSHQTSPVYLALEQLIVTALRFLTAINSHNLFSVLLSCTLTTLVCEREELTLVFFEIKIKLISILFQKVLGVLGFWGTANDERQATNDEG